MTHNKAPVLYHCIIFAENEAEWILCGVLYSLVNFIADIDSPTAVFGGYTLLITVRNVEKWVRKFISCVGL